MSYTATAAEVLQLRRVTGEPAETSSYTDLELSGLIESVKGDLHGAAYHVWTWKAAAVAALFDWSADGGDYKQSALYDRYKAAALDEWKQSSLCGMIVDPTEKDVV